MKAWIFAAVVAVVVLAAAGIYFLRYGEVSAPPATGGQNAAPPASIKIFRMEKPAFVAGGENLSKVEVWAVRGGTQELIGTMSLAAGTSTPYIGDTWTMPIPSGLKGATEIFARGYDKAGNVAAKIDLSAADLKNL